MPSNVNLAEAEIGLLDEIGRERSVTLYNVFFPIWLLLLFPLTWIAVVPVNFAVDSAVLLVGLARLGVAESREVYRQTIAKVLLLGFLADLAGALVLIATMLALAGLPYSPYLNDAQAALTLNPWRNALALAITTAATALSAALIYHLNLRVSFRQAKIAPPKRRALAIALAVITAPWVFYFPSGLFYR